MSKTKEEILKLWSDYEKCPDFRIVLDEMLLEIQSLKEKLSQYESGHKGTCSTCEVVGELNVELEKRLERTREIIKTVYLLSNEIFLTPVNPTNSEKRRITRLTYQIMESLNNWLTQNNQTKENEK